MQRLALAHAHQQAGRGSEAEQACRDALALVPDHVDALNMLGGVLMRRGCADDALATLQRAAQAAPASAMVHTNLARAALQCGLPEIARQAAQRAVESDPARSAAWSLLGSALKDLDRLQEAIAAFERTVQLAPEDPSSSFNLAVCENLAGQAAKAASRLQALLSRFPGIAAGWQALGNACAAQHRTDDALAAYRRALALEPNLVGTWVNLGVTCLEAGRIVDAGDALRRALALAPSDPSVLAATGVLATRSGDAAMQRVLFAFDALLHAAPLAVPSGFDSDAAFFSALEAQVLAHPTLAADPANKTTREGRQSSNLAAEREGALGAFVAGLHEQLPARMDALQQACRALRHPAANSLPPRWRLNLWATVLHRGGHQEPHLHPSGWLSGVFYLRSPACEVGPSGWIEFGPAPAALAGGAMQPLRALAPQQGLLLTFPSYLYHRTVPHADDRLRISLAFDVTPIAPLR